MFAIETDALWIRLESEFDYFIIFSPLAYPETLIRVENKTIYTKMVAVTERAPPAIEEKNPAPGVCLPIIVAFCKYHKVSSFHCPRAADGS